MVAQNFRDVNGISLEPVSHAAVHRCSPLRRCYRFGDDHKVSRGSHAHILGDLCGSSRVIYSAATICSMWNT